VPLKSFVINKRAKIGSYAENEIKINSELISYKQKSGLLTMVTL